VKSTPAAGSERVPETARPQSVGADLFGDGVLFVERSGERSGAARLRQREPEPQRRRVRTGRRVAPGKPETG